MKKAAGFVVAATWLTGKAAVVATKGLVNGVRWSASGIARHREEIAGVTSAVVRGAGGAVESVGRVVADGAQAVADKTEGAGSRGAARGLALVGRSIQALGTGTRKAAPTVGQATAGGVSGAVGTVADALDAVAISEREIAGLQQRLEKANRTIQTFTQAQRRHITDARQGQRKQDLLDWLAVGGISLSAMARTGAPPDVEAAFALAYPGMAARGTRFMDAVEAKSAPELLGLVNGVKGKLFETELVAHLNDGNLPAGLQASLAASATQPGYDLLITDRQGQVVDMLQAKATDSVAYVRSALERYPDIDVTTTTEVYAQLMAQGVTNGVTDSGISEAVLQSKIESAAQGVDGSAGWAPGSASVALLALSAFMDKSVSLEQRGAQFGQRTASVGVTGAAGKAALAATGYWWLGLAAGVGARVLAQHGGGKRARLESLRAMVAAAERVAKRAGKAGDIARARALPPPKVNRRRPTAPKVADVIESGPQVSVLAPPLERHDRVNRVSTAAGAALAHKRTASAHVIEATVRRLDPQPEAEVRTLTARDVVYLFSDPSSAIKRQRRIRRATGVTLAAAVIIALGMGVWMGMGSSAPEVAAGVEVKAPVLTPAPRPLSPVEAELKSIMDDALERYPYLGTPAGLEATRQMIVERDRRLRQGASPQDALRGAVNSVAPKLDPQKRRPKPARAQDAQH